MLMVPRSGDRHHRQTSDKGACDADGHLDVQSGLPVRGAAALVGRQAYTLQYIYSPV